MEPLFMKPVFQEKIWGGSRLHSVFGFDLPNDKIGEDWAISAHPHGVSVIENGPFKGKTLADLWRDHQELFGHSEAPVFPLLINIIDAEPGAEIIYGNHAQTKEELKAMIEDGRWDDLLTKVPVKKGDFFYVPSGTIHAIGKGIMILETQQSSDTTYRVYDYDRTDDQGKTRELHIQQSVDVTTVPAKAPELSIREIKQGSSAIVTYLETEFFNVYEWEVRGKLNLEQQADYTLMTVIDGYGQLVIDGHSYELKMGTSCILPNPIKKWTLQGELTVIASEPGENA